MPAETKAERDGLTRDLRVIAITAARRAAPVFEAADWTYTTRDGKGTPPFVPDQEYLERMLIERLAEVAASDRDMSLGTGRFHVWRCDEGTHISFGIDLSLTSHHEEVSRHGNR